MAVYHGSFSIQSDRRPTFEDVTGRVQEILGKSSCATPLGEEDSLTLRSLPRATAVINSFPLILPTFSEIVRLAGSI